MNTETKRGRTYMWSSPAPPAILFKLKYTLDRENNAWERIVRVNETHSAILRKTTGVMKTWPLTWLSLMRIVLRYETAKRLKNRLWEDNHTKRFKYSTDGLAHLCRLWIIQRFADGCISLLVVQRNSEKTRCSIWIKYVKIALIKSPKCECFCQCTVQRRSGLGERIHGGYLSKPKECFKTKEFRKNWSFEQGEEVLKKRKKNL